MLFKSILNVLKTPICLTTYCPSRIYHFGRKMQNVYIRHQDGDEQFQVSFQLKHETLGLDRQFNFSRRLSEKVNDFLARITANVERTLNKKNKKKKKKPDGESDSSTIEIGLLHAGQPVSGDYECKDVIFSEGLALKLLDLEFPVILNAPWVNLVTLPGSIMAGFPAYPLKFEVQFSEKSSCHFSWHKNSNITKDKNIPTDWSEVGAGYYYTPDTKDIGFYLKLICTPRNGDIIGPPTEIVSNNPVEAGPGTCPFELRHAFTRERLNGQRCVANHNILLGEELKTNPIFSEIWEKFVVLDSVDNKERIIVTNTHQYFHPDADHIRLLQTGMTVMYLENLNKERRVSYIFCGDFNSTPDWGVYRFITTQHIPEDCIDWASNKEEEVKGVSLTHSLQFSSAYGTPEFTNYTAGFAGCLDYIFYQHDQLQTIQVVPLPSIEELQQHTALPSVVFPSDHVALIADLMWK
ncbi:hypothetical protein C0J52_05705 [Blattella germanica]|nr:hypothetical protein C0J52_05705 [Blattella germanica]